MLINQHNYGEFFLLYVDGELSAADKQAVERFVQANPGLADELKTLTQMKLSDELFIFDDKHSLYRYAADEISSNNYEEHFLLYVDNELDADSKEKVETFVLQHPDLQESFTLLKQTRLQAETILFPGKKLLFKKEIKARPVFYLHWQRMAVAAALTGIVILAWTLFPANDASKQTITKGTPVITNTNKNNTGEPGNSIRNKTQAQNPIAVIAVPGKTGVPKEPVTRNGIEKNNPLTENSDPEVNGIPAANNLHSQTAGLKREDIVTNPIEATEQTRVTPKIPISYNRLVPSDIIKLTDTDVADAADNPAESTVYRELDTDDENKSLYLGSIEINKDKLRGFFRKAGSLFRGKAKQEDEKTESTNPSNTRTLK